MLTCFLCALSFGTALLLFRHLKLVHGMYPGKNLKLKCGQIGCCLQFSSYSGFRRHLNKIHATVSTCVPHETPSDHDTQQFSSSQCLNDETPSTSSQCQNSEAGPSFSNQSKDMCASIIARLLGSGVPNTIVLSTVQNLEEFVGDWQSNIQEQLLTLLPNDSPSRSAIADLFKNLELYYDEFECASPLGSKKGIHKVGCLYFILRNLPPSLNSALMNIHLVSLFYAQDTKKYGIDEILKPLVKDLKILETSGIAVPFAKFPVFGTLAQITGDNLGMHSILGFLESFRANYFCRFCLIDQSSAQFVFSKDDPCLTLRSPILNNQHYNNLVDDPTLTSSFGIKRKSILNH